MLSSYKGELYLPKDELKSRGLSWFAESLAAMTFTLGQVGQAVGGCPVVAHINSVLAWCASLLSSVLLELCQRYQRFLKALN